MIFVILAGRRTVWEFFSYRIVPVDASMRRTLGADRLRTSDESAAGVDSAGVSERTKVLSKEKMFLGEYCPDTKNGTVTGGKNCFQGAGLQKEGQSITGAFGIPPKILGFSVTYLQKGAACDVSTSF